MTAAQTPGPAVKPQAILRDRPFRTLWLAQFVSIFGDFLALFGVISLITFRMHGTAVQVTAVTIAYILPLAVISPVAGVFGLGRVPAAVELSEEGADSTTARATERAGADSAHVSHT